MWHDVVIVLIIIYIIIYFVINVEHLGGILNVALNQFPSSCAFEEICTVNFALPKVRYELI